MAPNNDPQLPTTGDGFHRAGEHMLKAMANNPKVTRGALLGLAVVIVAAWGGLTVSRTRAKEAGFALVEAFALRDAPLTAAAVPIKAMPQQKRTDPKDDDGDDSDDAKKDKDDKDDDGSDDDDETLDEAAYNLDPSLPKFVDAAARDAAAYKAFESLAHDHPGALGTLAALEAAALADANPAVRPAPSDAGTKTGKDTLALLARATSAFSGQSSILTVACLREAQLAEDAGDTQAALAHVERVVASQSQFLGDEAQIIRARLLMQAGDLNRAREALEYVQNNYPSTALSDELRIEMASLDAKQAASPATQAATHGAAAG